MAKLNRLFHMSLRSTLPRLRHDYTNGLELDEPDEAVDILLQGGLVRDWANARRMVKRQKKTPGQLFWELSKKRKADWRGRLGHWVTVFFGGYIHDPHANELRELAALYSASEDKKSG